MAVTVLRKPSNGVSYGEKVAWANTADPLIIDFQSPFNLVADIQLTHPSTGAVISDVGTLITYPSAGKVQIDADPLGTTEQVTVTASTPATAPGDITITIRGFVKVVTLLGTETAVQVGEAIKAVLDADTALKAIYNTAYGLTHDIVVLTAITAGDVPGAGTFTFVDTDTTGATGTVVLDTDGTSGIANGTIVNIIAQNTFS